MTTPHKAADELAEAVRALIARPIVMTGHPGDNVVEVHRLLRPMVSAVRDALARYDAARAVPVWEEWSHGCDALCQNVTFWAPTVIRCPHCGRPAPERAAPEEVDGAQS